MFKYKKTIFFTVVIILAVGGYYYQKSKKPKVEYTTQTVQRGTLAQTVSVTGKVVSPVETDLSFKISGQVESLLFDVGDRVEAGQKVATIDKGTLPQDLLQARAEVSVQKNILYDMKRRKVTYSSEQEESQRGQIKKAEEAVREIQKQISYTTLYSPISGTVIRKNVEVGEITVANAVTENTSVVTVAADGDLEIRMNVPESDILKVEVGQNVSVTFDAFPSNETFLAKVKEIEPASTVIQDVVYYKVRLSFDSLDPRLRNGMSADADIHTAEKQNVVFIPERAVRTEDGKKYVEILKDEKLGVTEKIDVETGMKGDDGMIEITKGLSGGEKVVTLAKSQ